MLFRHNEVDKLLFLLCDRPDLLDPKFYDLAGIMKGSYCREEFEIERVKRKDYVEAIQRDQNTASRWPRKNMSYSDYKGNFRYYSLEKLYHLKRTLTKRELWFGDKAEPIFDIVDSGTWSWKNSITVIIPSPIPGGNRIWAYYKPYVFKGM